MPSQGDVTLIEDVLDEFKRRLFDEWLPAFCHDEKRQFSTDGFNTNSIKVSAYDAYHFMRALDHNIVINIGGGRYRMPQSKAQEQIFWTGAKGVTPRSLTLWIEPIITIAAMARLHFDYGWPLECLGTQSEKWEFDVIAFKPGDLTHEYIAGEVKKTSKEIDTLLMHMMEICTDGSLDSSTIAPAKVNAHRKCLGLRRCNAPFFWALGPDNDSRLFNVLYHDNGKITFESISCDNLYWK